jgi:hypothetical protein
VRILPTCKIYSILRNIWTAVRIYGFKTDCSPSRYRHIAIRTASSILRNTDYSILLPTLIGDSTKRYGWGYNEDYKVVEEPLGPNR